jgi:hypothetical protein
MAAGVLALLSTEAAAQSLSGSAEDRRSGNAFGMMERPDSARVWWDSAGLPLPFGGLNLIFSDSFEDLFGKTDCSIFEWTENVNIVSTDAGLPSIANRRFSSPCGLRVPIVGGEPAYLQLDLSSETTVNVRFYGFFDGVSGEVAVLSGLQFDSIELVFVPRYDLVYNFPTAGDLSFLVFDGQQFQPLTIADIGPGWHAIEIEWQEGANAPIALRVGGIEVSQNLNTAFQATDQIQFGAPFAEDLASGSVDLDAFEARRIGTPALLLNADSNDDGLINVNDLVSMIREVEFSEFDFGQPDCNADGFIDSGDYQCVLDLISGTVIVGFQGDAP